MRLLAVAIAGAVAASAAPADYNAGCCTAVDSGEWNGRRRRREWALQARRARRQERDVRPQRQRRRIDGEGEARVQAQEAADRRRDAEGLDAPRAATAARRRSRALARWLLVRGRGDRPRDRQVDPDSIRVHSSSKRPSVEPGELAILYAAVWQALYGVVEIVSVPEQDPARERWAWRFAIRPRAVVSDLT